MWEYILMGLVAGLSGAIGTLIALKTVVNVEKILEIADEVAQDEHFQRQMYALAGVVGQGLAQGSGLQGMTRAGKPKLKDIAISMGLEYLKQFVPMGNATPTETPGAPAKRGLLIDE